MTQDFTNVYDPPAWLTKDLLQVALRKGLRRGSLIINKVNICPATNVGDNCISCVFRALVNVESETKGKENISLIIKSMPKGEKAVKYVNDGNFFVTETKMLLHTLPIMQKMLKDIGEPKICAELYYHQEAPDNLIILEDLSIQGFKNHDRINCLDLAHSKLAAESLATFHAASLVAMEKDPKLRETYGESFWQEKNDEIITKFINDGIKTVLECLESWKSFPSFYIEKLEKLKTTGKKKLYQANMRIDSDLNVLNHGDPWTTNLMFQYQKEKPVNSILVDFQLCCYNSLVFDLLYFIFTSTRNEVRIEKINDILVAYHTKLVTTCKNLNFQISLSFEELKEIFLRRLFLGFFIQLILFPFMILPPEHVTDLNEWLSTTERPNYMIENAFFKETIKTTYPFFIEHGIFD